MIEVKQLHEWVSWRDEWTYADVEKALADAGLVGWKIDHWSDGDIQFMHGGAVSFDDLATLRGAFTPQHMSVEGMSVEPDLPEDHPLYGQDLMVLVTMSWSTADAG